MHWNYRVFELKDHNNESYFELREVYYDDQGRFRGYVADGASPLGETILEIRGDLGNMLLALDKPVLKESDFPKGIYSHFEDEDDNT